MFTRDSTPRLYFRSRAGMLRAARKKKDQPQPTIFFHVIPNLIPYRSVRKYKNRALIMNTETVLTFSDIPWKSHGDHTSAPWEIIISHGNRMRPPMGVPWASTINPWESHRIPSKQVERGLPCESRGSPTMGNYLPWESHGATHGSPAGVSWASTICPSESHRDPIPMEAGGTTRGHT